MTQGLGPNCNLFKMDLENAFRLLPIKSNDFPLLGFKFNNEFYIDKALPFCFAICCNHFEQVATFLEFAVKRRMNSGELLHYLDDFWVMTGHTLLVTN